MPGYVRDHVETVNAISVETHTPIREVRTLLNDLVVIVREDLLDEGYGAEYNLVWEEAAYRTKRELEESAPAREYQEGYRYQRQVLGSKLSGIANITLDPTEQRQLVHDIAIGQSKAVANDFGDRGRGLEHIMSPEYDRGRREAIMEWSHEHNHRLIQKINQKIEANPSFQQAIGM
jgi:hypothetical protein